MITLSLDHLFRAQFGEDRILWQVFRQRISGYFIEVGAYDGVTISNTYFLEQMGWCGLLVEPIPLLAQQAAAARPHSRVICAAAGQRGSSGTATFTVAQNVPVLSFLKADEEHKQRCIREGAELVEIEVALTSLDRILMDERRIAQPGQSPWDASRAGKPAGVGEPVGVGKPAGGWNIDLVSIDTEGCEMDVLDGFDLDRFKPRVLVLENDRPSGGAIEPYLTARGYRKFHRQKINDFYVRASDPTDDLLLSGFHIPQ